MSVNTFTESKTVQVIVVVDFLWWMSPSSPGQNGLYCYIEIFKHKGMHKTLVIYGSGGTNTEGSMGCGNESGLRLVEQLDQVEFIFNILLQHQRGCNKFW